MPAVRSLVSVLLRSWETFLYSPQGRPCGRPPAALRPGSDTTVTGAPASPIPLRRTLTLMAIPAFTQRGFWTRIVVFSASLLIYAWGLRLMAREHSILGIAIFSILILFSGAGLIATVIRRPPRRSR
jgi:hypothetical protein